MMIALWKSTENCVLHFMEGLPHGYVSVGIEMGF